MCLPVYGRDGRVRTSGLVGRLVLESWCSPRRREGRFSDGCTQTQPNRCDNESAQRPPTARVTPNSGDRTCVPAAVPPQESQPHGALPSMSTAVARRGCDELIRCDGHGRASFFSVCERLEESNATHRNTGLLVQIETRVAVRLGGGTSAVGEVRGARGESRS